MNRRLPFLLARPRCQQGSSVHATSAPHFPHPHPGWLAHPCPRLPSMQRHCLPEYVSQPKLDLGSATRAAMSTPPDLQLPTRTVYCRQTRDRPPEGSRQQCCPPGTVVGLWDSYVATAEVAVGPLNFLNCWTETFFIV